MDLAPAQKDPVITADWAELAALYSETGRISLEAIKARIDVDGTIFEEVGEYDEELGEQEEEIVLPGYRLYEQSEELVDNTIAEIERRSYIAKDAYPFNMSPGMLHVRPDYEQCLPYIFCLLVADRKNCSPSAKLPPRLFEHLVKEALAQYLGGEAVRFGWPRDTMAKKTKDAINELAEMLKDERLDAYPVKATDKDLWLDVAGWKSFSDERSSKLEVFMQCATGEDWGEKRGECTLALAAWEGIIRCSYGRLSGLAVPYIVADDEEWARTVAGLLFMDRLRIATVLSNRPLPDNAQNFQKWCKAQIKKGSQQV